MRQVVLDTETTGLEVSQGHRVIEIGCVELQHRRATGRHFHSYLNPEREVDAGARAVHGLSHQPSVLTALLQQGAPRLGCQVDGQGA